MTLSIEETDFIEINDPFVEEPSEESFFEPFRGFLQKIFSSIFLPLYTSYSSKERELTYTRYAEWKKEKEKSHTIRDLSIKSGSLKITMRLYTPKEENPDQVLLISGGNLHNLKTAHSFLDGFIPPTKSHFSVAQLSFYNIEKNGEKALPKNFEESGKITLIALAALKKLFKKTQYLGTSFSGGAFSSMLKKLNSSDKLYKKYHHLVPDSVYLDRTFSRVYDFVSSMVKYSPVYYLGSWAGWSIDNQKALQDFYQKSRSEKKIFLSNLTHGRDHYFKNSPLYLPDLQNPLVEKFYIDYDIDDMTFSAKEQHSIAPKWIAAKLCHTRGKPLSLRNISLSSWIVNELMGLISIPSLKKDIFPANFLPQNTPNSLAESPS